MKVNRNFLLAIIMTAIIVEPAWVLGYTISPLQILMVFIVSHPYRIGKTLVIGVFGGINNTGSVFSIVSVYQKAELNAWQVLGLGYQKAGNDAWQVLGLAYQKAGRDALQVAGLAYQKAGRDAEQVVGLAYQKAGNDAWQCIGFLVSQTGRNIVQTFGIRVFESQIKSDT